MKKPNIPDGLWPVMLTPFTEDGSKIDYATLEKLVNWYIDNGSDGLFAVCQSSEMFFLSAEERKEYARFVVKTAAGRVPVVASGHVADDFDTQLRDANEMYETGIDALVLLPNRFATQEQTDDDFIVNMDRFLQKLDPAIPLGMYECPYPYKRVMTPKSIAYCADSGRFCFVKDTCCDMAQIQAKLDAVHNPDFKIFNANCATLLDSMKAGVKGFSGVMANFHPYLYSYLTKHYKDNDPFIQRLQDFVGITSCIECKTYPYCAKIYLHKYEIPSFNTSLRSLDPSGMPSSVNWELDSLYRLSQEMKAEIEARA